MIDFLDKVHHHEPRQIELCTEPVTRQDNEPSRRQETPIEITVRRASRIGGISIWVPVRRNVCASRTTTQRYRIQEQTRYNGSNRFPSSPRLASLPRRFSLGNIPHHTIHPEIPSLTINRNPRRHDQHSRPSGRHLGIGPAGSTQEQGLSLKKEIEADGWKGFERCQPSVQMPRLRRDQEDAQIMPALS